MSQGPSQVFPQINGTAQLSVERDPESGSSYAIKGHIKGWPHQSEMPDGRINFKAMLNLLAESKSAFGERRVMVKALVEQKTRCFDWTLGPDLRKEVWSGSYLEGQGESEHLPVGKR